jgi:hypothetical protein
MRAVFGNSSIQDDLYNITEHAPLGQGAGLRHEYRWGLYGYCAYILHPKTYGDCSNTTFAAAWNPFETLRSDIPPKYFVQVNEFIISQLRDSPYLGTLSHVGFYLIFVATLATILVIPLYDVFFNGWIERSTHIVSRGLIKTTLTFLFSAILSCAAAAALLIAASMWTSAASHVQITNQTRTGIVTHYGHAVWLTWAAFAFSLLSVLPYVIRWVLRTNTRGARANMAQLSDIPTLLETNSVLWCAVGGQDVTWLVSLSSSPRFVRLSSFFSHLLEINNLFSLE